MSIKERSNQLHNWMYEQKAEPSVFDVSAETRPRADWWKLNYHPRERVKLRRLSGKLACMLQRSIAINSPQAGNVSVVRFTLTAKHITQHGFVIKCEVDGK